MELGEKVPNMLLVNADLAGSTQVTYFMEKYPERTVEVGIAEQNMIGVATGLSMMGYLPFVVTFARFASKRASDQVSLCVDYCNIECAHYRSLCRYLHRGSGRYTADDL